MSLTFPNLVLPSSGLGWNFAKRAKFSTISQEPQSMRHPASATLQKSTIFELELSFNGLSNNPGSYSSYSDDAQYIQEFYEACRGGYGWFAFDPSQYSLATMNAIQTVTSLSNGYSATGDGLTRAFQLWRSTSALGAGNVTQLEMIQNVTLLVGVYGNGILVPNSGSSAYTLSNFPATITFTSTAPSLGTVISWAGNYSYLCKFSEDVLDMNEFLYQLWELKSLKLDTIIL